jgi:hypothetical protein
MAGRLVDMVYLFHIELFKNGCFEEATGMTGKELFMALNAIPLSHRQKWAPWFGYDFMNAADWARNVHSKEGLAYLVKVAAREPDYIQIACDSELDWEQKKKAHFTAKYWLYNVKGNGQSFAGGIDERHIEVQLALIGDLPLKGLTELSQIQSDYKCFDYIKTWLDNNWRKEEQIPKRSIGEIRNEILSSWSIKP